MNRDRDFLLDIIELIDDGDGHPDDGYGDRFGLIYVDFDTLERTPKLSAEWFREASRHNAVV